MLVAVVVEAIAVIAGGFGGVGSSKAFNPLLTAGALAPWIALGMVGTTALIAVMVKATLRGDAGIGRAVRHGLLLPGGRHGVHGGGRREGSVPAGVAHAAGDHGPRRARGGDRLAAGRDRARHGLAAHAGRPAGDGRRGRAGPPSARGDPVGDGVALVVGLASGLALYVGTRVFVAIAGRWEPFRRHVVEKYRRRPTVSLPRSLALSLLIMVPAEELFWRGLFQAPVGPVARRRSPPARGPGSRTWG